MLEKCTAGKWDYVGDHIVGVVGNCNCPVEEPELAEGEMAIYSDRAHESHDVVPPVIEDDLPEGVTMEEHMANCKLIAAAVNACKKINAENPIAAAEAISEIWRLLSEAVIDAHKVTHKTLDPRIWMNDAIAATAKAIKVVKKTDGAAADIFEQVAGAQLIKPEGKCDRVGNWDV